MASVTVRTLAAKKRAGEPIVALTAYDAATAMLEQKAGVDLILVGDSMNMAVLGEETTLTVDLEVMLAHTRAVSRGAPRTLVVGDMPFGSYEESDAQAVGNAVRFLAEGAAHAVKLEGGNRMALSRAGAIVEAGIPVMGHLGLLPQSLRLTGGYRVVRADGLQRLQAEAAALEDAGVFSIVLESVQEDVAAQVTAGCTVPTIGIGAGRGVDGQILVVNDMLGLTPGFSPRFLKRYADLAPVIEEAVRRYAGEVREGVFPGDEHVYGAKEEN
ncbi:MAG: 3-methyl-2-oxobutanoate hydroxymethyltransferase [Candidatus Fermentibacteraceae bacterium]